MDSFVNFLSTSILLGIAVFVLLQWGVQNIGVLRLMVVIGIMLILGVVILIRKGEL